MLRNCIPSVKNRLDACVSLKHEAVECMVRSHMIPALNGVEHFANAV